jgi:AbiV family abortive infection protein
VFSDSREQCQTLEINAWETLLEAFASGQASVFETIDGVRPQMYGKGDHQGFVNFTRSLLMMMQDTRFLQRLRVEMNDEIERVTGKKYDDRDFERAVRSKDGPRLMQKLGNINAEMYGGGPTLLQGATFKDCLSQYHKLIGHVEALWQDACRCYRDGHFPLCTFLSILAIEEVGKLGRLWYDLLAWDCPSKAERSDMGTLGRDHRKKHFMGVIAGAVINARLDRILGHAPIKKLLQNTESGRLEALRQSCLYIDIQDGRVVTPQEVVTKETARFFAVLAGELWAEILGHFPWEFELMLEKVIAFETSIGFQEAEVGRR